jgi:hypothetical protein
MYAQSFEPLLTNLRCGVRKEGTYFRKSLSAVPSGNRAPTIQSPCVGESSKTKLNSVALGRKRTIQTERPPLVGEVSAYG